MELGLKVLVGLACISAIISSGIYIQKNVGYAHFPLISGLVMQQK